MDKLKKRLDELETIQNNIKLLTELLAHYKPDSGEGEKALMQVCCWVEPGWIVFKNFLGWDFLPVLKLDGLTTIGAVVTYLYQCTPVAHVVQCAPTN